MLLREHACERGAAMVTPAQMRQGSNMQERWNMGSTELVAEWTLKDHSTTVTCIVARCDAGFWVAVGVNDDTVLKELHPARRLALTRAAEMEAGLIAQGFHQARSRSEAGALLF
jgi:hypothetical protein